MCEIWNNIPGYEGIYQVSNCGRVRSIDRIVDKNDGRSQFYKGKLISPFKGTTCSYLSIALSKNNEVKKFLIHRLVAMSFLGLQPNSDLEVNHKNGIKTDNRVDNLEVVSHQANIEHSIKTLLKNDYGELSVNAKLTNEDAEHIRQQYKNGVMQVDLAKAYNVSKQTICNIIHYKRYWK